MLTGFNCGLRGALMRLKDGVEGIHGCVGDVESVIDMLPECDVLALRQSINDRLETLERTLEYVLLESEDDNGYWIRVDLNIRLIRTLIRYSRARFARQIRLMVNRWIQTLRPNPAEWLAYLSRTREINDWYELPQIQRCATRSQMGYRQQFIQGLYVKGVENIIAGVRFPRSDVEYHEYAHIARLLWTSSIDQAPQIAFEYLDEIPENLSTNALLNVVCQMIGSLKKQWIRHNRNIEYEREMRAAYFDQMEVGGNPRPKDVTHQTERKPAKSKSGAQKKSEGKKKEGKTSKKARTGQWVPKDISAAQHVKLEDRLPLSPNEKLRLDKLQRENQKWLDLEFARIDERTTKEAERLKKSTKFSDELIKELEEKANYEKEHLKNNFWNREDLQGQGAMVQFRKMWCSEEKKIDEKYEAMELTVENLIKKSNEKIGARERLYRVCSLRGEINKDRLVKIKKPFGELTAGRIVAKVGFGLPWKRATDYLEKEGFERIIQDLNDPSEWNTAESKQWLVEQGFLFASHMGKRVLIHPGRNGGCVNYACNALGLTGNHWPENNPEEDGDHAEPSKAALYEWAAKVGLPIQEIKKGSAWIAKTSLCLVQPIETEARAHACIMWCERDGLLPNGKHTSEPIPAELPDLRTPEQKEKIAKAEEDAKKEKTRLELFKEIWTSKKFDTMAPATREELELLESYQQIRDEQQICNLGFKQDPGLEHWQEKWRIQGNAELRYLESVVKGESKFASGALMRWLEARWKRKLEGVWTTAVYKKMQKMVMASEVKIGGDDPRRIRNTPVRQTSDLNLGKGLSCMPKCIDKLRFEKTELQGQFFVQQGFNGQDLARFQAESKKLEEVFEDSDLVLPYPMKNEDALNKIYTNGYKVISAPLGEAQQHRLIQKGDGLHVSFGNCISQAAAHCLQESGVEINADMYKYTNSGAHQGHDTCRLFTNVQIAAATNKRQSNIDLPYQEFDVCVGSKWEKEIPRMAATKNKKLSGFMQELIRERIGIPATGLVTQEAKKELENKYGSMTREEMGTLIAQPLSLVRNEEGIFTSAATEAAYQRTIQSAFELRDAPRENAAVQTLMTNYKLSECGLLNKKNLQVHLRPRFGGKDSYNNTYWAQNATSNLNTMIEDGLITRIGHGLQFKWSKIDVVQNMNLNE